MLTFGGCNRNKVLCLAQVLVLFATLLLAGAASAGHVYRMVGGQCADSNRSLTYYYDDAVLDYNWAVGPTLCSNRVTAELVMRDSYVPGDYFVQLKNPELPQIVESFAFYDGSYSRSTTFPIADVMDGWGLIYGGLPDRAGPAYLNVSWSDGWYFAVNLDGTWLLAEEFRANGAPCGLGSIEGPYPTGVCNSTEHYFSVGTYATWVRVVPEPPALASVAIALVALVACGRRARRKVSSGLPISGIQPRSAGG